MVSQRDKYFFGKDVSSASSIADFLFLAEKSEIPTGVSISISHVKPHILI